MKEEDEFDSPPAAIIEAVEHATLDILPEKSRRLYMSNYTKFKDWCMSNGVRINEDTVLAYFYEKSKRIKPSSLWSEYSMVKSTLLINDNVDISKFEKLKAFLKRQSVFCVKKLISEKM